MNQEGVPFREAVKIAEGITGQSSATLRTVRQPSGRLSGSQGSISGRRSESNAGLGRRASSRA